LYRQAQHQLLEAVSQRKAQRAIAERAKQKPANAALRQCPAASAQQQLTQPPPHSQAYPAAASALPAPALLVRPPLPLWPVGCVKAPAAARAAVPAAVAVPVAVAAVVGGEA
jgi:hypothetical protein